MPGVFISFEGGEGAGKTSQLRALLAHLRAAGWEAVETRDPGGTPLGTIVRGLLLDPARGGMAATAELLLYEASRAQLVHEVIRPALARGRIVLCDRFTDSTIAYQGHGRGMDLDLIARLNALAADGLRPDLTFLLDLDPEVGLARAEQRRSRLGRGQDRMEEERLGFHQRVRAGYLALATAEPERLVVVDAARGMAEIEALIRSRVEALLHSSAVSASRGPLRVG